MVISYKDSLMRITQLFKRRESVDMDVICTSGVIIVNGIVQIKIMWMFFANITHNE
jgi:hypothetical protein